MSPRSTGDPAVALKPLVFHVLVALLERERHGYAIVKEIESRVGGHIEAGNLYRTLRGMTAKGLIEESDRRPDPDLDDERRRYFRVTAVGVEAARAEAARLEGLVDLARSRELLTP